jgi:hypothetical protein
MAVFMDKANKRCELSTKRAVFADGREDVGKMWGKFYIKRPYRCL